MLCRLERDRGRYFRKDEGAACILPLTNPDSILGQGLTEGLTKALKEGVVANIGRIKIEDKVLLAFLQFPFGKIVGIRHNEDFVGTEILIEDNEMPEVPTGCALIPNIRLSFTTYQDCSGNKVSIREPIGK